MFTNLYAEYDAMMLIYLCAILNFIIIEIVNMSSILINQLANFFTNTVRDT